MSNNKLFEQIVSQSSNKKLKENDDDDSEFLYDCHNKLVDLFNLLYEETADEKEWATIVTDALNNSDISEKEFDALKDSLI